MSRRPDQLTPWYDLMRPEGPIYPHEAKERYVHRPHVEEQVWRLAESTADRKPVILVGAPGSGRTAMLRHFFHLPRGQRWDYLSDKLDRVDSALAPFISLKNLKRNRRKVGALTPERLAQTDWSPDQYHRVDLPTPDALFLQNILFLRLGVTSFPGAEQRAVHRLGVYLSNGNIRTYLRYWRDAGSYAFFRSGDPWPNFDDGQAAGGLLQSMAAQAEARRIHKEALAAERRLTSVHDADTGEE